MQNIYLLWVNMGQAPWPNQYQNQPNQFSLSKCKVGLLCAVVSGSKSTRSRGAQDAQKSVRRFYKIGAIQTCATNSVLTTKCWLAALSRLQTETKRCHETRQVAHASQGQNFRSAWQSGTLLFSRCKLYVAQFEILDEDRNKMSFTSIDELNRIVGMPCSSRNALSLL